LKKKKIGEEDIRWAPWAGRARAIRRLCCYDSIDNNPQVVRQVMDGLKAAPYLNMLDNPDKARLNQRLR
jgi:hypothetical protein